MDQGIACIARIERTNQGFIYPTIVDTVHMDNPTMRNKEKQWDPPNNSGSHMMWMTFHRHIISADIVCISRMYFNLNQDGTYIYQTFIYHNFVIHIVIDIFIWCIHYIQTQIPDQMQQSTVLMYKIHFLKLHYLYCSPENGNLTAQFFIFRIHQTGS